MWIKGVDLCKRLVIPGKPRCFCTLQSMSRQRGSLMEGDLPARVAVEPDRAALDGGAGFAGGTVAGGAVGDEDDILSQRTGREVREESGRRGRLGRESFEGGCFVVDAAGCAELKEVVGDEAGDGDGVFAHLGLKELFFEGAEVGCDVHGGLYCSRESG